MRKLLSLFLVFMALFITCAVAGENEEGSEGTIVFLDAADTALPEITEELTEQREPFIPNSVEKTILGTDDRVTVRNTREYPYSAIALMQIRFKCGCRGDATGYMVDRNKLLTAAHCMICQHHNEWVKSVVFNFGYRKGKGAMYKYNGRWHAYCATSFPDGYHDEDDWAYIRLDKNVGDKTGWFGRRYLSDRELENRLFFVAGYREGVLKYDFGGLRKIDADRMWVDMDVLPGNSGSPIYDYEYYAVGIWTTYWDNANSGIRLTQTIANYVNNH